MVMAAERRPTCWASPPDGRHRDQARGEEPRQEAVLGDPEVAAVIEGGAGVGGGGKLLD